MLDFIFATDQLVFTIPLCLGLMLSLLSAASLFDFGADMDVDLDADTDLDFDHLTGIKEVSFGSMLSGFLEFMGFGTVPAVIVVTCILIFFGLIGLIFQWQYPLLALTIPASFVLSILVSSRFSRLLAPLFRDYGEAVQEVAMEGKVATLTTGELTATFGAAVIVDEDGLRHTISVRALPDTVQEVQAGDKILLVKWEAEKRYFFAQKLQKE